MSAYFETIGILLFMTLCSQTRASVLFPWHPFNPHLQHYIRTQLEAYHPRNEYHLRRFYQDAETRCQLRLWRISRSGELRCEKHEDCENLTNAFCRNFKVCRMTEGGVCWSKSPLGEWCSENEGCISGQCDTNTDVCVSADGTNEHHHS